MRGEYDAPEARFRTWLIDIDKEVGGIAGLVFIFYR